jgi:recombination protein RecA
MPPKKVKPETEEPSAPSKLDKLAQAQGIATSLNRAAMAKNKNAGPVAFVAFGNEDKLDLGEIATGNIAVDEPIGGGWNRGAVNMIAGQEGAGKTCLCLSTIAHNQRINPEFVAVYINLESKSFPLQQAINAEVDLKRLIVVPAAENGEAALETMLRFLWDPETKQPRNLVDLIVIDSVAAMIPQAEVKSIDEKGLDQATVGRQAAMFSKALRHLVGANRMGNSTILFVNQYRKDINSYGSPNTMPGGNAVKYYAKIIVEVTAPRGKFKKKEVKEAGGEKQEIVIGHTVVGKVGKNNTGKGNPHARFEYVVMFGQGVDLTGPLLDAAIKRGVIEPGGSGWFRWEQDGEEKKFQTREKFEALIRTDVVFRTWLEEQVAAAIHKTPHGTVPEVDGSLIEELEAETLDPDLEREVDQEIEAEAEQQEDDEETVSALKSASFEDGDNFHL